jgi:hypothetical protein
MSNPRLTNLQSARMLRMSRDAAVMAAVGTGTILDGYHETDLDILFKAYVSLSLEFKELASLYTDEPASAPAEATDSAE